VLLAEWSANDAGDEYRKQNPRIIHISGARLQCASYSIFLDQCGGKSNRLIRGMIHPNEEAPKQWLTPCTARFDRCWRSENWKSLEQNNATRVIGSLSIELSQSNYSNPRRRAANN